MTRIQRGLDTRAYCAHTRDPGSVPVSTYAHVRARSGVCPRPHAARGRTVESAQLASCNTCEILNKAHDQVEGDLRSKDGSFEYRRSFENSKYVES